MNTAGHRPLLCLITRKIPPLCDVPNSGRAKGLGRKEIATHEYRLLKIPVQCTDGVL